MRFIARFQNFKKLHCKIKYDLTDNCIKNITECQNLEYLSISYAKYKLSPVGEKCFNKLRNIKSITLVGRYSKNLSHVLLTLRNCKNLEYVDIPGMRAQKTIYTKRTNRFIK